MGACMYKVLEGALPVSTYCRTHTPKRSDREKGETGFRGGEVSQYGRAVPVQDMLQVSKREVQLPRSKSGGKPCFTPRVPYFLKFPYFVVFNGCHFSVDKGATNKVCDFQALAMVCLATGEL